MENLWELKGGLEKGFSADLTKCVIGRGAKAERYYYNIVTDVFHLQER